MRDWNNADNPFASFGREEPINTSDDEEEGEDAEETVEPSEPKSLYDVELTGTWGDFFGRECVLRTRNDTFFFDCGKKSFECSRSEANKKSKRVIGGPVFYYRSPSLRIGFSMLFPLLIKLAPTNATMLQVAKLIAWSKTSSDDEMESAVRREITGIAWNWIPLFAWIPLSIGLSFSAWEWANGWMAALGPLHGVFMVFIGYVVAMFKPNTRWAAALPTGCLACSIDYFVRYFFVLNPDVGVSYLFYAFVMLVSAGLCYLPFILDADVQRAFTQELNVARSAEQSTESEETQT